jgi:hypothetical protein
MLPQTLAPSSGDRSLPDCLCDGGHRRAGVSVFAASAPANAKVVFTSAHTTFNSGTVIG